LKSPHVPFLQKRQRIDLANSRYRNSIRNAVAVLTLVFDGKVGTASFRPDDLGEGEQIASSILPTDGLIAGLSKVSGLPVIIHDSGPNQLLRAHPKAISCCAESCLGDAITAPLNSGLLGWR